MIFKFCKQYRHGIIITQFIYTFIAFLQTFLYRLVYNATNNVYSNNDGVTIRVPGFGETETIEFINTDDMVSVPGYNTFVQYFVDRGYVRGKTIRAAPYDWRLAAG